MLGLAEELQRTLGDSMSTASIAERLNRRLDFVVRHAPTLFARAWQAEGIKGSHTDAARALAANLAQAPSPAMTREPDKR